MLLPKKEDFEESPPFVIMWHRRDLRISDNTALAHAVKSHLAILPIFIFDKNILDKLEDKDDSRVSFIYEALGELSHAYERLGGFLQVYHGKPLDVFSIFASLEPCKGLYTNEDYEPYARERDKNIEKIFLQAGKCFYSFKDQVIFSPGEILTEEGRPYTVFTPFSKKWLKKLAAIRLTQYSLPNKISSPINKSYLPRLEEIGFVKNNKISFPERKIPLQVLSHYKERRDFPYLKGTTRLGVHLRFGTLSIRQLVFVAISKSTAFLHELIWREFFMMLLWYFPHTTEKPFRTAFEAFPYRKSEEDFEAWCNGKTGYPLVDAGMRELNETGFMHNRVRMVVASFLTKHLLLPWQWGERYFARKLLDFELASNVGNWQWAAGCGADAAPYFRIFNPELQQKKFDPEGKYVRQFCSDYMQRRPPLIISHEEGRKRALLAFESIKERMKNLS
ncbi:MAG: DNA photolyase family protein [Leptospiraceae bacterium]|nr:DNA photolyase family protein [Leptospiraceae bacterium]MDW8306130.1 deoxyribodipyrimidine photo-lyase [Leptospiraceae bacterium]